MKRVKIIVLITITLISPFLLVNKYSSKQQGACRIPQNTPLLDKQIENGFKVLNKFHILSCSNKSLVEIEKIIMSSNMTPNKRMFCRMNAGMKKGLFNAWHLSDNLILLDNRPHTKSKVIFFGDSIMGPWRLGNKLNDNLTVFKRCLGGSTNPFNAIRFFVDCIIHNPDYILIITGINDLYHFDREIKNYDLYFGKEYTPTNEEIKWLTTHFLEEMIICAQYNGIKPVLFTLLPVSQDEKFKDGHMSSFIQILSQKTDLLKEINQWLRNYCQKENLLLIDSYSYLSDSNGNLPTEYTDDGVHLNDTSSDKLTHFFYARLKEYNTSDFPNP